MRDFGAERLVEIGPSPTLAGMAKRTLKQKFEAYDAAKSIQRDVLCYSADAKSIYYDFEEPSPAPAADQDSTVKSAPTAATPATTEPTPVQVAPASRPAGPAQTIPDEAVKAVDIVHALIAQKLKKPIDEIALSKPIKDLVGGKSTLQNEILGDLGKEFGNTPEKPEDTPLDELGAAMQATFNGQLGKQSSSLVQRLISSKMPAGFNITSVRSYLADRWGLGPGRIESVTLLALTMEPAGRLGGEAEAKSFLDTVTQKYASKAGISLDSPSAGGASSGAGNAGVGLDPAQFAALTKNQTDLAKGQLDLYARFLKIDLKSGEKKYVNELVSTAALQSQIDLWESEHGDIYAAGIVPVFSHLKARVYDSHWNWARQDALDMYFDIIWGRLKLVDREIVSRCIAIMNRSNPTLLDFMQYHIDHCPEEKSDTYKLAKSLAQSLLDNCKEVLNEAPVYKDVTLPTAPATTIDAKGNLSYAEVTRPGVRKLEQYVQQMAAGGKLTSFASKSKVQNDLGRIYRIIKQQNRMSKASRLQIRTLYADVAKALAFNVVNVDTNVKPKRRRRVIDAGAKLQVDNETIPFLHLKKKSDHGWEYSSHLTDIYLDGLESAARDGVTFQNKSVLMTGCGAGSIGAEVMQGLLSGGAKVVVTTSRYSRSVTEFYQQTFARFGSKGSSLIVVPFNQGSKQDVDALVDYIYDSKKGLGWDLDCIIPFAAIPGTCLSLSPA